MKLPSMVHPIDEGILGEKAVPMSGEESHEGPVKEDQPSTSKAVWKIIPTLVTTEVKREVKTPGKTKAVIRYDTRCYGSL